MPELDPMALAAMIPGAAPYLTGAVFLCAAVATMLPAPKGKGWYAVLYAIINKVALNVGKATNAGR